VHTGCSVADGDLSGIQHSISPRLTMTGPGFAV
jgi:hypothetical protein